MKTTKRESSFFLRFGLLLIFSALGVLAPPSIHAQWTTPDASQNINNTNTGNVGIGTTTPGTSLDIAGNILNLGSEQGTKLRGNNTTKLARLAMPPYTTANMRFSLLGGATTSTANIVALGGEVGGMAAATQIDFFTSPTTNVDTGTLRMTITGAGNIGVGTSAPEAIFQLHHSSSNTNLANIQLPDLTFALRNSNNTNGNMSLISFQDAGGWGNAQFGAVQTNQTTHSADLVFFTRNAGTSGERVRIKSDGNVGIGTTTPAYKLDVTGEIRASVGFRFGDGTTQTTAPLMFKNIANSSGVTQFSAASNSDSIRFAGSGGTNVTFNAGTKQVTIDATASTGSAANIAAGQFGQNTGGGNYTFPGNVTVTGNLAAKYQDIAEWVESSQKLEPGTVVVIDTVEANQVVASTQSYDSRIAGVISVRPGLALGEQGEGRILVATTGRVKVKVDATNGPIQMGDLLVTSDREGFAMKSVPVDIGGVRIHRPGTLIGKALESLAQGKGEILVLLSLQ